ncbi:MAG: PEP-CTERM sorting domain-containing protein [Thermoguttaceae bacterium]|jgi:T5SS/PEP-CTERM-associated repeat protein
MFLRYAVVASVHVRGLLSIFVLGVVGILIPNLARADIVTGGDVEPEDPSTWSLTSTNGVVGNTASGTLTVDNGSNLACASLYLGNGSATTGVVSITGFGSTLTSVLDFQVGFSGKGNLSVTSGGSLIAIANGQSNIGYETGSSGTVTVSGTGSNWTDTGAHALYVGRDGNGSLLIRDGGAVTGSEGFIGREYGAVGVVTIDGPGSNWSLDNFIYVGGDVHGGGRGNGTLSITNGGTFLSSTGANASRIGADATSVGVVTVEGSGSSFTINSSLLVGGGGTGTLSVLGGGTATVCGLSVSNTSLAAVDVGRGSLLADNSGAGTLTNNGTIRILAGAGVPANGVQYSPISAGSWGGTGTYQAVGGTWNTTNQTFTASSVTHGTSGTPVALDLASVQRTLIDDSGTGWEVGTSFLAKPTSTPLNFTATVMNSGTLNALQRLLAPGQSLLSGWNFSADAGYTVGDPVYFSFKVGSGYSTDGLDLWDYNGTSWTPYVPTDLTYDGTFASFTATGLSGYAVAGVAVPEPSTLLLLGVGAVSLLAYAWRRRRV